jgi:hypothetical protein
LNPKTPKTTDQRGYGAHHKALRKRWAPKVAAGTVNCRRCGERIQPGAPWDLGHDDNDRSLPPAPECRACNRAIVSHLKQAAGSKLAARWSRHWYPGSGFDSRCPDCRALGAACSVGSGGEV